MSGLVRIGKKGVDDDAPARAAREARWAHLRPTTAQLYVENRCHLSCAHCYETSATHPAPGQLSFDEWVRVFDELAALGVLYLTFTGGEIFLRRDVIDLVAEARKRRFAVTLFTSGTLLDEAKADRIRELRVSEVHVSVYSDRAEDHDAFTGVPGSHAKSLRALRMLGERGTATVMKSNVTTFNVDRIDAWIALATSVGADWQLDPTVKPRMDGDRSPLRYAVPPRVVREKLLGRADLVPSFRRHAPGELCAGDASILDDDAPMCGAARDVVSIGADGAVSPCGFWPGAAGNVRDAPLADVWRGAALFDEVRSTTLGRMNDCGACDVRSTCTPCMAYALIEHGDARACSTPARATAEGLRDLAEARRSAERKMASGRALPLVGVRDAPAPPGKPGRPAVLRE